MDVEGLHLHYVVRMFPAHTDTELLELAKLVQDKPDHPRRAEFEETQRRRARGPDIARYQAWFSSNNRLRVNRDLEGDTGFLDQAVTPDLMWTLSRVQLTLVDPEHAPKERDVRGNVPSWERDIGFFRFAGAHLARSSQMEPVSAAGSGDTWTVIARTPHDLEYAFRVRWDAEHGRGFILGGRQTRNAPQPAAVGSSFVVSDWRDHGAVGWLAERIDEFYPDGRPRTSRSLEAAEPCDPATLAQLTAEPSTQGADPVRGAHTFAAVYDLRPSRNVRLERQPTGFAEYSLPPSAAGDGGVWLRRVGWGALVCVTVALVLIRLKRGGAPG